MPKFRGDMDATEVASSARTPGFPGLDTEIAHRRAVEDGTDEISIGLGAVPRPPGRGRRPCNAPGSLAWRPRASSPSVRGLPQPGGGASRPADERGWSDYIVGLRGSLGLVIASVGSCLDRDGCAPCLSAFRVRGGAAIL
jgi:hypothetical protein